MATSSARALVGEVRALNCLTCQRQRTQARPRWSFHNDDVQLAKRRKHTDATGAGGRPAVKSKQRDAAQMLHEFAAQSREHPSEQIGEQDVGDSSILPAVTSKQPDAAQTLRDFAAQSQEHTEEQIQNQDSGSSSTVSAAAENHEMSQQPSDSVDQNAEPRGWRSRRVIASPSSDKWLQHEPEWQLSGFSTSHRAKYDYEKCLTVALREEDAPRTNRCLAMVISDQNTSVLDSMSDEAFNTVLKLIHPLKAYGNVMPLLLSMRPELYKTLKLPGVGQLIDTTRERLRAILGMWKHIGKPLRSIHYSSLLEITRYIRGGETAKKLWEEAYKAQFNVKDFNNYLASILYDRPLEFKSEFSERALPHFIYKRTWDVLPPGFRDFRTGGKGILSAVTAELSRMGEYGFEPDAETYAIFVRAASLEGKLARVREVLQTVWGMDTTAIIAGDDGFPKLMSRDDPLYPTSRLLGEVVRAYGNNNDILGASKILEFMSRFYEIEVAPETWLKLLQHSHLLATPRQHESDPRNKGNVPRSITQTIWQKMLSPPHSAAASIHHADLALRSANRERQTHGCLGIMNFFKAQFIEATVVQRQVAWDALAHRKWALRKNKRLDKFQDRLKHPRLGQLVQRYTECDLECQDALTKFRSWLFYIMHDTEHHDESMHQEHYIVEIPRMLRDWAPFSERVLYYFIPTGIVELDLGEQWHEDNPLQQSRVQKEFRNMLRYRTLDPNPFNTSTPEDEPTSSVIHYLAQKTEPPVAQVATIGHGRKRSKLHNTPENRWPVFNSSDTPSPQVQDTARATRKPLGDRSWLAMASDEAQEGDSLQASTRKPLGDRSWLAVASDEAWEGNSVEGRQNYWRHEDRRQKKARTAREPLHDPWRYAKPISFKQRVKRMRARMQIPMS